MEGLKWLLVGEEVVGSVSVLGWLCSLITFGVT